MFKQANKSLLVYSNSKHYLVIGIILIGIVIRLVMLEPLTSLPQELQQKLTLFSDAQGYHRFAMLIYEYGINAIFHKFPANEQDLAQLTTFRTPGYPLFLATIYRIFGVSSLIVCFIQILLDALTGLMIFYITKLIFKNFRTALIALSLYISNPLAIAYSTSLYAECFFTALLTLIFLLLAKYWKLHSDYYLIAIGLLLGILTLIKPIGMYLLFIPLIFWVLNFKAISWKQALPRMLLVLICFLGTLSIWQIRNYQLFGHYSLTSQMGREILVWRIGTCEAWTTNHPKEAVWADLQAPFNNIADPFERSKQEGALAWQHFQAEPLRYLDCHLKGVKNFFFYKNLISARSSATRVSNTFLDSFKMNLASEEYLSRIYQRCLQFQILLLIGVLVLLVKDSRLRPVAIFSILLILYFANMAGIDGYSRYSFPLIPTYSILTAYGFNYFAEQLQVQKIINFFKGRIYS